MDPRRRAVCSLGTEDPTLLPHLRKLPQENHLEALVLHLYIVLQCKKVLSAEKGALRPKHCCTVTCR